MIHLFWGKKCIFHLSEINFRTDLNLLARPIARISERGVQLDLVGNYCSRGLGAQPPDADKGSILDVL